MLVKHRFPSVITPQREVLIMDNEAIVIHNQNFALMLIARTLDDLMLR